MVGTPPYTSDANLLSGAQWIGVGGICMMVMGVFSPAMSRGLGHMSLVYGGNTIAAIVLGISAASAWSLNRRDDARLYVLGVLAFVIIAFDLVSLQTIDLTAPQRRSPAGFAERHHIANAWTVMLLGALLLSSSAWQSRLRLNEVMSLLANSQAALWAHSRQTARQCRSMGSYQPTCR